MSPPRTTVMAEITGVDGNVKLKQTMLSKSWVRNAYCWCIGQMGGLVSTQGGTTYGVGTLVLKDIGGSDYSSGSYVAYIQSWGNYTGIANLTTRGIVIGTGDTAESFEHHSLASKIANGKGAGQMQYLAQAAALFLYDSANKKYTARHVRGFSNNSGGSITVKETGMDFQFNAPATAQFMVCRDLFSPTIAVANGETLTITYEISLVFPE